MPLVKWSDEFSVGVAAIDHEHQELVGLLNAFYDAAKENHGKESLCGLLDALVDYTKFHFANEEKLLAENGYPDLALHKQLHQHLTRQVLEEQKKYASAATDDALSLELLTFLKNWLVKHIQGTDKRYGPHLNSKGIH